MVGHDEDRVVLAEILERGVGHVQVVVAAAAHCCEIGIVVEDDGAFLAEQLDDGEGRRFAQIVDVALVGQSENKDLRTLDGLALLVESRRRCAR